MSFFQQVWQVTSDIFFGMTSYKKKKSGANNLESLMFDLNEEHTNFGHVQTEINWVPQFDALQSAYPIQYHLQQDHGSANQVVSNYECLQQDHGSTNQVLSNYENEQGVFVEQQQMTNENVISEVNSSTKNKKRLKDSACSSLSNSKGKDLKLLKESDQPEMTLQEKIAFVKAADFSKKIPMRKGSSMLEDIINEDESIGVEDNGDEENSDEDKENETKNISKLRQCLICNRKYANNSYFRLHCREIHNLCVGPKRCQKMCTLCGGTFSSEESYQDHEQQTKSNLIYCLEKVQALKGSSKANSHKNFKNVSAIDLQLMSRKGKKIKLSE
jgi:hypothetical protein